MSFICQCLETATVSFTTSVYHKTVGEFCANIVYVIVLYFQLPPDTVKQTVLWYFCVLCVGTDTVDQAQQDSSYLHVQRPKPSEDTQP